MGCLSAFRAEFRLSNLGFAGVKSERFFYSQWHVPVWLYLTYRFLVMVYVVFWICYIDITHGDSRLLRWAFLTNWTYFTLTVYLSTHFLAACFYHWVSCRRPEFSAGGGGDKEGCCGRQDITSYAEMLAEEEPDLQGLDARAGDGSRGDCQEPPDEVEVVGGGGGGGTRRRTPRPPWYACVVWVLLSVVSTGAVVVTTIFFLFLFPLLRDYPHLDLPDLQLHLLNSVLVVVENLLTAAPFRLLHVVYPFIYGLIYMFFSVVYWSGDHRRVMYPGILDWNHLGSTTGYVLLVGFVYIPLLHSLFFLLYKAKMAVYRRFC